MNLDIFDTLNTKMMVYRKKNVFSVGYSFMKNTLSFAIAPAFDPNRQMTRTAAGTNVYNYEASAFFSLNVMEISKFLINLPKVKSGEYMDPKSDGSFVGTYVFSHFKDNQPSRLLVTYKYSDKLNTSPVFTINSFDGKKESVVLAEEEAEAVYALMRSMLTVLTPLRMFLQGVSKYAKSKQYDEQQGQGQGNRQYNNAPRQQYNNSGGGAQQQRGQYNKPPQSPPPSNKPDDNPFEAFVSDSDIFEADSKADGMIDEDNLF